MQCWQCGVTIRPGQKLCVYCGAKLTQDDAPGYEPPAGSARARRRSADDGGMRSNRAADDAGGPGESDYAARSERYGSRGSGEREQRQENYYRPGGGDASERDDGRSARRPGGTRLPSRDPLDDPRAPRGLRSTPSSGRSSDRGRGGYESQGYDDAEYEYDDYNPRDQANPRYQPRFDPDSAEYDAVADQRRQARVHPRQDESRSRGAEWDAGSGRASRGGRGDGWDDPRGSQRRDDFGDASRRDEYGRGSRGAGASERGGRYRQERDGYSETESAEYPASYDDRGGRRDRGGGSARGGYERHGREPASASQQGYGGGWDSYESRNAGGYGAPPDNSWNQPAAGMSGGQDWGGGRTWNPGTDPNSWAPPGMGYPSAGPDRGMPQPPKKRRRVGLIAAMSALVVLALLGGGYLGRSKILALLHRGGATTTTAPGFATYTPGPTPTALANYNLYVSTRSLYAVQYPAAWNIQNKNYNSSSGYDYVDTFQQVDPPAEVGIESAQAFNTVSDTAIIDGEVIGAKQGGMSLTQIGSDVTVTIGGERWTRRDYAGKTSNGVSLHMAILAGHHAGRAYAIVLTAATADFVKEDAGVFKTILSTFRFTT